MMECAKLSFAKKPIEITLYCDKALTQETSTINVK